MSVSVLVVSNDPDFSSDIKNEFKKRHPHIDVFLPNEKGAENAVLAACWHPPSSLLTDYPNLKVLHALSAGADHLGKTLLNAGLPVCRIVDPAQKHGMFEYILWGILNYQRAFDQYRNFQTEKQWRTITQRPSSDTKIGLLGLGEIGSYVAQQLTQIGYTVNGWSRSQKDLTGVNCYSGADSLDKVVADADVLVNLLPLNNSTQGILSQPLFNKMPRGSYVINCGRGGHMIQGDLIEAIDNGQLNGALLDVFDEEPLSPENALWESKGVIITPHIASSSSLSAIVDQIAHNGTNFENGTALNNQLNAPS